MLLKRGGYVVYHGELGGKDSSTLVDYFERLGAPKIELGENPANWMLRVVDSGDMGDLAEKYANSQECADNLKEIDDLCASPDPSKKIEFEHEFATPARTRRREIFARLRTIYWRSPTYNYTRLLVSLVIAFVLGSSFVSDRNPFAFTESEMQARVSVIFLSFIITGIMAMLSVLPVMTKIRDMFYRHRDSGMYDSISMGLGLGVAEKWFILLSSTLFTIVFLATSGVVKVSNQGVNRTLRRALAYWVSL